MYQLHRPYSIKINSLNGFILSLLIILSLFFSASAQAQNVYTFGVVPQQSASRLAKLWSPVLAEISLRSGVQLKFVTAPDIPTFEKRLSEGKYDFAYMNPYHYTVYHESPGYQALLKAKNKKITGIMVTHKDSDVTDLFQLSNQTLAFPAPKAFAASMLTQAELKSANIPYTPKYVTSHDSVYLSVARGIYPAGGGVKRTLRNLDPILRQQLKILWTSDGYTPHAIAYIPNVIHVSNAILEAFVELDTDEAGQSLLNKLKINGFVAAENSDWNDVRNLNINTTQSIQDAP